RSGGLAQVRHRSGAGQAPVWRRSGTGLAQGDFLTSQGATFSAGQRSTGRQHVRGGSPREGARSELASGAATGGGGPQAPPTRTRYRAQTPGNSSITQRPDRERAISVQLLTVPREVVPGDVRPFAGVPGEVIPGQVVPGQIVPREVVPGEVVPGEIIPGEVVPREPVPDDPVGGLVQPRQWLAAQR